MPRSEPAHYDDLEALKREAFLLISRGVKDRNSAFHTPMLATHGEDGFPAARTVVLRSFDAPTRTLSVHTDRRSRKIADLAQDRRASIAFYDARSKVQIRVFGEASVHAGDAVAADAWQRVADFSRRCYLGAPPGSASDAPTSGLPPDMEGRAPTLEESEPGFHQFAVIRLPIQRLDWLYLAARGQRRAVIGWDENGVEQATWVAP